ncbi:MAG: mandelate racemase/muconate lactonizing enzyme family protein, partial [Deltaproteobacteria bacterium]|nr:mandelate racemase/muconate lactonizing enzyme family protein [Deltaproteobacteria bacterium]
MTRRNWLRIAAGAGIGPWMNTLRAYAEPHKGKVKITGIKAMQVQGIAGNTLIKVETDAGLVGYGEAGSTGPMARSWIKSFLPQIAGKDPLSIELHFHNMSTLMHTYMANVGVLSGIDIALWDLAGKITGQPVNVLLGGPFRDAIKLYSHAMVSKPQDVGLWREWAAQVKAAPEGFSAFKIGIDPIIGVPAARYTPTLDSEQVRKLTRAFAAVREAAGEEIDIALHCHNELDVPSAIRAAQAIEPVKPLFYEDALNPPFSEGWMALRRATRVPLLTGEKLELVRGFKPFLDNQAVDYIHPDLAFAGGFTGTRKIADYAQLTRTPLALHNVGSLILCYASAHFGSAIHNFFRSESALGRPTKHVEKMSASGAPDVRNSLL